MSQAARLRAPCGNKSRRRAAWRRAHKSESRIYAIAELARDRKQDKESASVTPENRLAHSTALQGASSNPGPEGCCCRVDQRFAIEAATARTG